MQKTFSEFYQEACFYRNQLNEGAVNRAVVGAANRVLNNPVVRTANRVLNNPLFSALNRLNSGAQALNPSPNVGPISRGINAAIAVGPPGLSNTLSLIPFVGDRQMTAADREIMRQQQRTSQAAGQHTRPGQGAPNYARVYTDAQQAGKPPF